MALSRKFQEFVPGLFVVLPQPLIDRLGPLTFPIQSKIPVMILTKKQFVVWNAVSWLAACRT
jgi:pyruvate/2-oxoglutarate/acetoin dehydrogenase E1 component